MLRTFLARKRNIVVLTAVAALAVAGAAFAYFSSAGTGSGSATVGSSTPFTVTSDAATGGLLYPDPAPGGTNVDTIAYHVHNPSAGQQNLNQVVISVADSNGNAWSSQTDTTKPACTASDFSVGGESAGSPHTDTTLAGNLAAGATADSSVSLELIDNGHNQDNCQGVTVPLFFSAS